MREEDREAGPGQERGTSQGDIQESSWVPVSPKEKKEGEDKVFPEPEPVQAVDISQIVSTRLSAMRKLQDNPHDIEAIKALHNVQKEMQNWALSKQEPWPVYGFNRVK
ncbi:Protein SON, partial [Penaeus vannamei]